MAGDVTRLTDPVLREALRQYHQRLATQERIRREASSQVLPSLRAPLAMGQQRAAGIAPPRADQDGVTRGYLLGAIEEGYRRAVAFADARRNPQPPTPTPFPPTPTPTPIPIPPFFPPTFTPAGPHPNQPTQARVRDVQASFCSMLDSTGLPIFDPAILGLSAGQRADWYARKHSAGVTHIAICAWLFGPPYRSAGFTYDVPTWDFRSNPSGYLALLDEMVANGFVPIIFLSNGQFPAPGQNPAAEYTSLRATADFIAYLRSTTFDFGPCCLWTEAWEPGWTSPQFAAMFNMMRIMLPDQLLALHTIAGYIHNGAGAADWSTTGCWREVDVLLAQFHNTVPPLDPNQDWYTGLIELCDRILPPGHSMPAAEGALVYNGQPHSAATEGPYYFGTHGKEVTVCPFEYLAFQYIRGIDGVDDAWVARMQDLMQNGLGFRHFGHLPG